MWSVSCQPLSYPVIQLDLLSENAHADHTRDQGEQGDQDPADGSLFERTPSPVVGEEVESAVQL